MTINSPAAPIWAMYIVAAEKAGVPRAALEGTTQNDILKEFVAQKEFLFPPEPSMRLVTDTIEFGTHELPRWNTISISGYHIREAGSTAIQELAFTIADGMAYVEAALERGLRVDDFAPRLSFFFNSHSDFFEEIAKFRAARRIWYKLMTERYRAENERSTWMRFHTQTAGVSLTPAAAAEQPDPGRDPGAGGGPRRDAVAPHRRLRRGARGADRRGRAARPSPAADHRRGDRRREHDRPARRELVRRGADERDRARGLALPRRDRPARRHGRGDRRGLSRSTRSPTRPIASSASSTPASGGSSASTPTSTSARTTPIPVLAVPPGSFEAPHGPARADAPRARRRRRSRAPLAGLREAAVAGRARRETNLMPHFIRCAAAYATLGEQCGVLRGVFGEYREPVLVWSASGRAPLRCADVPRRAVVPRGRARRVAAVRGARRSSPTSSSSARSTRAHGWSGRDLMGHLVAWQQLALDVAKELAVGERARRAKRRPTPTGRPGGDVDQRRGRGDVAARSRSTRSARSSPRVAGELRGYLTVVPGDALGQERRPAAVLLRGDDRALRRPPGRPRGDPRGRRRRMTDERGRAGPDARGRPAPRPPRASTAASHGSSTDVD